MLDVVGTSGSKLASDRYSRGGGTPIASNNLRHSSPIARKEGLPAFRLSILLRSGDPSRRSVAHRPQFDGEFCSSSQPSVTSLVAYFISGTAS